MMTRTRKFAAGIALSLALLAPPATAVADDIKSILQFLAKAKLIDQKLVDASALIQCFAEHSPEQCVNLQQIGNDLKSDATSAAEKKAAEFVPDDPMVKTAIDIVRAVLKEDWLRVLELTGVKLLGQVACTGALAVTGPLNQFICGEFAEDVLDNAEPVVHEILVIVRDFPKINVWKLVTVVGFDLTCNIVKGQGVPLADEACGLLGEAIKAIKNLADAVGGVLTAGAELINDATIAIMGGGSGKSISPELYYNFAYQPLMYKRALQRLVQNRQDLGLDESEFKECLKSFTSHCAFFEQRLRKESEALVKLVLTMPDTYANGFLGDAVKQRAVDQYGQGQALLQYANKLPMTDWAALVDGQWGVSLMAGYTGTSAADQEYLKGIWKECRSWVNDRLTGSANYGVPTYDKIAPESLTNWICFKGAAQQFFQAVVDEEKRLAKIKTGLNSLGCPSSAAARFAFNCQSHISFSICVNQSYKDYGKNLYCKADRDKTAHSLGASLVDVLGETRCRYIPLSKGNSGDFDPRVQCSRPWKEQTCAALLDTFRAKFEVPSSRIQMRCTYTPDKPFKEQEARAKQILAALNGTSTVVLPPNTGRRSPPPSVDSKYCKTLWDPLAINCPHQTKMPALSAELATPAIESCPQDPSKNGANQVCYQTVFTADDSNKEIYENQTLSPVSAAPPNVCSMDVNYYVPLPPIIESSSSSLQVGDQVQVQCAFEKRTQQIEWEQCDGKAKKEMESLKYSQESASRYSGMMIIDNANVGIATSPIDGGDFKNTGTWIFNAAGAPEISCQVDNGLYLAGTDMPLHLQTAASISVGGRSGTTEFRAFDPAAARRVSTSALTSRIEPLAVDGRIRLAGQVTAVPSERSRTAQAPLVIEAESLIGTAVASAGQIIRQDMAGFGSKWGGDAQLFWRPPAPAASKPQLRTVLRVPAAGTYELVLFYTTAPDFGQFTVYIDGSKPKLQDGYGPQVALRQAVLGRYTLAAGRHELAFEVTGKSGQSTGYIVGIDRLQLTSIP
jgi:hypothetical protein